MIDESKPLSETQVRAAELLVMAGTHPNERSAFDRMLEDAKLRDAASMDAERFDGMS